MKFYGLFEGNTLIDSFDPPYHTEQEARDYLTALQAAYPLAMADRTVTIYVVREVPSERRVTNAPVDYDGFGTRTFAKNLGGSYRMVDIQTEHMTWQETRYASGMYGCLTPRQWGELKPLLIRADRKRT